jgi:peptidyl-prolyl cis-trans isomerase D
MLSSFRNLSKSKGGQITLALLGVAILASLAVSGAGNYTSKSFGLSSGALAKVGSQELTEREVSKSLERLLGKARQQKPDATYADLSGEYDPLVTALLQEKAIQAFADSTGMIVSRRLVDAEIARIPGTRGLDGKFSEQSYRTFLQQQRLTDQELRQLLTSGLLQRLMLTPVAGNARMPLGVATPYASMLLEAREGEVQLVPTDAFRGGLNPTEADLQRFYAENKARYTVPEQRVLRIASIGPEQVASITASDKDIADYYNANQATYGGKDIRMLSQAVVPDRKTADAIAARARSGASFAAAAAPAGLSAADVSVGPQTREQFGNLAGVEVAAATFAGVPGSIIGPIQSDLGWHVIKIESSKREAGATLAAVSGVIAARLTADKRKEAVTDLVTKVEDEIAGGSSFAEAVSDNKLTAVETPPLTAGGVSRSDPAYKLPPTMSPLLKAGFDASPDDDPTVETLPGESSFALLAVGRIIESAPAPFATVRAQVANDWISKQASERARAVASAIAAKAGHNIGLEQARTEAGVALPALDRIALRRIDLAKMKGQVPAPVRMLFNLGSGKSRMVAAPNGQGFYIIRVLRIIPGNALNQPMLIGRTQAEFGDVAGEEYAQEFIGAIQADLKVRRNENAIADAKKRLINGGS